jgi:hypothetical protein
VFAISGFSCAERGSAHALIARNNQREGKLHLDICRTDGMMQKLAGEIILPPAFLITLSFAQLHHLWKYDVVKIDNEYNGCYYLNASLYSLMSELMFE